MLSLSTFVTRLSWLPAARSKAQFTCRAACWSSVPTLKAHTTIPLLGRRRPPSSIAHQAGALRSPEKRCKSLATSRSTMRAPSRIWRKRAWRQSQLRSLSSDSEPTASSGDWALERLSAVCTENSIRLLSLSVTCLEESHSSAPAPGYDWEEAMHLRPSAGHLLPTMLAHIVTSVVEILVTVPASASDPIRIGL